MPIPGAARSLRASGCSPWLGAPKGEPTANQNHTRAGSRETVYRTQCIDTQRHGCGDVWRATERTGCGCRTDCAAAGARSAALQRLAMLWSAARAGRPRELSARVYVYVYIYIPVRRIEDSSHVRERLLTLRATNSALQAAHVAEHCFPRRRREQLAPGSLFI